MLAKQLQGVDGSMPAFMDLTTGAIRSKKPKKEKSPQEEAQIEIKKVNKKILDFIHVSYFFWSTGIFELG